MIEPQHWNKTKFTNYIIKRIAENLICEGFEYENDQYIYDNKTSWLSILPFPRSGRIPATVYMSFSCAIYINEVYEILRRIMPEKKYVGATFFFPIEAWGPETMTSVEYSFSWLNMRDAELKIIKISKLILSLIRVVERIHGAGSLAKDLVKKIPIIGRVYPEELKVDFRYCLPFVAAIGAKLGGELELAKSYINSYRDIVMPAEEKALFIEWIDTGEFKPKVQYL